VRDLDAASELVGTHGCAVHCESGTDPGIHWGVGQLRSAVNKTYESGKMWQEFPLLWRWFFGRQGVRPCAEGHGLDGRDDVRDLCASNAQDELSDQRRLMDLEADSVGQRERRPAKLEHVDPLVVRRELGGEHEDLVALDGETHAPAIETAVFDKGGA